MRLGFPGPFVPTGTAQLDTGQPPPQLSRPEATIILLSALLRKTKEQFVKIKHFPGSVQPQILVIFSTLQNLPTFQIKTRLGKTKVTHLPESPCYARCLGLLTLVK